eukprot:353677-Pyramimonas_sp.AAC.1
MRNTNRLDARSCSEKTSLSERLLRSKMGLATCEGTDSRVTICLARMTKMVGSGALSKSDGTSGTTG